MAVRAEDLSGLGAPGVTLSSAFIPEGPPSIESRFDEVFSVPWLIALALDAERDGVDALVIDCMGDPGLGPLREAVQIPVLGVAQTAMSVAAMLAQRFGVVTVHDRTTTMVNELVDLYGHGRHYVGCRPIGVPVLRIHDDPVKVRADLAEADAAVLVDEGRLDGITPPLTATEAFTMADLAAIASELTGRTIRRLVLDEDEWVAAQIAAGQPEFAARFSLGMYQAAQRGFFAGVDPLLGTLLAREPRTVRDVLAQPTGH